VEPTREAEAEWGKRVTGPTFITEYQNTCTPGYYNGKGKHEGQGFLEAQDPDGAVRFYEMLARWREQGDSRVSSLSKGRASRCIPVTLS